jgi:thiol:disulfide interchange protein DsbC
MGRRGQCPKVTVFSDFHCGYCRALHQTLKAMGARVIERPISILGTRAISESVICAEDKAMAMERAYGDQDIPDQGARACDTGGLDANEAFARAHGFTGTPVLVREDGAVLLGFRPREFLESWLKGGA